MAKLHPLFGALAVFVALRGNDFEVPQDASRIQIEKQEGRASGMLLYSQVR